MKTSRGEKARVFALVLFVNRHIFCTFFKGYVFVRGRNRLAVSWIISLFYGPPDNFVLHYYELDLFNNFITALHVLFCFCFGFARLAVSFLLYCGRVSVRIIFESLLCLTNYITEFFIKHIFYTLSKSLTFSKSDHKYLILVLYPWAIYT